MTNGGRDQGILDHCGGNCVGVQNSPPGFWTSTLSWSAILLARNGSGRRSRFSLAFMGFVCPSTGAQDHHAAFAGLGHILADQCTYVHILFLATSVPWCEGY